MRIKRLVVKEYCLSMMTRSSSKAHGKERLGEINHMATAFGCIRVVIDTKVNGMKVSDMEKELITSKCE